MEASRRKFLQTGLTGAGLAWANTALPAALGAKGKPIDFCVALCNHWSYIGIGWQLGIESNVLSLVDAMEMADRPPYVKSCMNLDARAYELVAEKFPEVTQRLKKYLAEGKVELIGGTYGQPMGTTISGESNIRQIVVGRETIRKALDYDVLTFLEEEEFSHPQVPQMVADAGFRYAGLAQLDTWGRAGCPILNCNALRWKGIDGTAVLAIPRNPLFGFASDMQKLVASQDFQTLAKLGMPLIFTWQEFGWESPETPAYLRAPIRYLKIAEKARVEFVTLQQYLEKYGAGKVQTIYLPMDAWNKSLTWGLGGDQIRILDRKVEGLLLAAERFDAIAALLGGTSQSERLDQAWKDLMTAQSHDVGLCEYSRWQGFPSGRMAPLDRLEDFHNFTWGAIGYNHLDAAQKQGQQVLAAALTTLAAKIDSASVGKDHQAVTVLNSNGWQRSATAQTGRLYPIPPGTKQIVLRDRQGRVLPSQLVKVEKDRHGNLIVADVLFPAKAVPSLGYDTYSLEYARQEEPIATDLRVDESSLVLENEHLRLALDATTGGILSLIDKHTGAESLKTGQGPYPVFRGRPNRSMPDRGNAPENYDSTKSKATLTWIERGPLRATLRAEHRWQHLTFETRISLTAGSPQVDVLTRLLAFVPPKVDKSAPDIVEGYWLSFRPAFEPVSVLRDFPFGVEATKNKAFHALTFADLLGPQNGLLLLHAGTQWFRREADDAFSNLLMREWESHFNKEFGWPIYSEYRHALRPHANHLSNAQRLQAAADFCQPLWVSLDKPSSGELPPSKSFLEVKPGSVQLTAFRKKTGGGLELRCVEVEGRKADATVTMNLSVSKAVATDLLGRPLAPATSGSALQFTADPWKIRTFEVT